MSKTSEGGIIRLAASPNNYDWGPIGNDSFITSLTPQACSPDCQVDPEKPYSELWMGTHPTAPARVYETGQLLNEYLSAHPEELGNAKKRFPAPFDKETRRETGEAHVPFLFKILCCKQALPLQIHPNVELACYLHKDHPDQFPDLNHKPEIAVCLSDRFLGFASFRPVQQIQALVNAVPEVDQVSNAGRDALRSLLSHSSGGDAGEGSTLVKAAWRAILKDDSEEGKEAVRQFTKRVQTDGSSVFDRAGLSDEEKANLAEAVGILDEYNSGDVAIFASLLFLNLVELKTGEGIYVGADGPHAWLRGDIVELMAISDNVLNVGFTNDKDSISLTTHAVSGVSKPAESLKLLHSPWRKSKNGNVQVYRTPFEEFSILHCKGDDILEGMSGPAIAIVTDGSLHLAACGTKDAAEKGSVYFVPANTELRVSGEGDLWMAFYDGDEEVADQVNIWRLSDRLPYFDPVWGISSMLSASVLH